MGRVQIGKDSTTGAITVDPKHREFDNDHIVWDNGFGADLYLQFDDAADLLLNDGTGYKRGIPLPQGPSAKCIIHGQGTHRYHVQDKPFVALKQGVPVKMLSSGADVILD
jgi:hypothetical protein